MTTIELTIVHQVTVNRVGEREGKGERAGREGEGRRERGGEGEGGRTESR